MISRRKFIAGSIGAVGASALLRNADAADGEEKKDSGLRCDQCGKALNPESDNSFSLTAKVEDLEFRGEKSKRFGWVLLHLDICSKECADKMFDGILDQARYVECYE